MKGQKYITHLMRLTLVCCCAALVLQSCDTFEAHPYDTKIRGPHNLNEKAMKQIETSTLGKDTIRFAFVSDTQRWYDETKAFVRAVNKRRDIDFVIHGGDLSDFGATHEFTMQRDILLGLKVPFVTLLGNHDCLGTGEDAYRKIFGKSNFHFVASDVLFVCLNTCCMEYDYSEPIPDFGFMEELLKDIPQGTRRTIVAMHVPPFDLEFNNNVSTIFQYYLKSFPNLLCCIYGHGHRYATDDLYGDGVLYHQTPCAKKRGYIEFTLTSDGYAQQLISF